MYDDLLQPLDRLLVLLIAEQSHDQLLAVEQQIERGRVDFALELADQLRHELAGRMEHRLVGLVEEQGHREVQDQRVFTIVHLFQLLQQIVLVLQQGGALATFVHLANHQVQFLEHRIGLLEYLLDIVRCDRLVQPVERLHEFLI